MVVARDHLGHLVFARAILCQFVDSVLTIELPTLSKTIKIAFEKRLFCVIIGSDSLVASLSLEPTKLMYLKS